MSEKKNDELYKYNHTVGLVTNASYLTQNLALLNTEDYFKADCLAVAHEGHINYIPLVNTLRRCKYVPICGGCDRGKGIIKWMRWVKINNDTYFVCLSTIGIQFYDIELTDVQFEFDFKELNGRLSLPLGACVLGDTLFVGTAMGMIVMFKSMDDCVKMTNHLQVSPFLYLEGANDCLVTVGREEMKSYKVEDGELNPVAVLKESLLLYSVLKIFDDNLFIGHHTGELSLMSFPNLNVIIKQKMHDGEILAIDYSSNKQILLTAAEDLFFRAWKVNESQRTWDCIYEVKNEDRPYCGIGFTNRNCTEFCCVKSNSLIVDFYIETTEETFDSSDDDFITDIDTVPLC
ncbi:uncharacterized protein LOC123680941 [Harmonia axyridis]|uniref:uncharacterized protein LOC123680941 n=1 Tax=Harmonia axyridis TaxID=115357 RepID=UPI001E277313|nr:uncharacterized protein LOC123680941 [Harmonia axyridis]